MSKIKKIIPIIAGITIVLSTIFILSDNVYAAISDNFAKAFSVTVNGGKVDVSKKSLAGIYYAMRMGGENWVKSAAPKGNDLKGWGNEAYAEYVKYGNKNGMSDDAAITGGVGTIARIGAICFGHERQENGSATNDIYVLDIDDKSDRNFQYLAYHIRRSINKNENVTNSSISDNYDGTYRSKNAIRTWIIDNIENVTGKDIIQTSNPETVQDYNTGNAKEYANYITNIEADTVYTSNPTIKYKGNDTFIGPYSIKIKGNTDRSKLTNATVNGETTETTETTQYCSIDGENIIKIEDVTNNSGNNKYNNFYIVVKNKKISSVNSVTINKNYNYYRARLVVSDPHGYGGQNIAIFYGYTDTKNITIDLPGVPYGNLQIKKTDKDTGKTLTGIGFKVYSQAEAAWLKLDENSNIAEYTTFDQATVIDTKEKGETVKIQKMPVGKYDIYETYLGPYDNIYELEKINVPGKDEKVKAKLIEKDYQVSGTKVLECKNEQEYVSLSGYVWVDNISGKQSTINNEYFNKEEKPDTDDRRLDGIIVKLMDKSGKVKDTKTANGGRYLFEKVSINNLENYYIEFEYDGLTYTNVVPKINKDNGSKAKESTEDRETYNEGFSIITGSQAEDTDVKTYGTTKIAEDSGTKYELEYKKEEHEAIFEKVVQEPKIVAATNNTEYKISDHFEKGTGQVLIDNINLGLYKREQPNIAVVQDVENIKLSINGYTHVYEYASRYKEENQKEYINQYYEEIYNGKERYVQNINDGKIEYIRDDNGDYVLVDGEYIHMNMFSVGVKYKTEYTDRENPYKRAIYQSDYNYFKADPNSNKLDVHITYKIKIGNQSTGLDVCVNSLVDYYDSRYNVLNVGTALDEQKSIDEDSLLEYSLEQTENEGYNKLIINTGYNNKTEDKKEIIGTQKEKEIYVEFELTEQAKLNILNDTENLNNIVEINSYSVFDKDKNGKRKIYAGIDKNSNPGNAVPGELLLYEDDTDEAPGILLEVKEAREISGTVFLDESTGGVGLVREGDGEYTEEDETIIKGVEVTLRDEDGKTVEVYDESTDKWEEAKVTTGDDGSFSIKGFIPGEYKLTYTWGDETWKDKTGEDKIDTVQDYKGTIYRDSDRASNKEWYKITEDRYSDAMDDYSIRRIIDAVEDTNLDGKIDAQEADSYSAIIQGKLSKIGELTEEEKLRLDFNGRDGFEITDVTEIQNYKERLSTMESTTPIMGIGIEEETDGTTKFGITSIETEMEGDIYSPKGFKIINIDFGIVERARQEIAIDKKVKSVEITLANGQTIASLKYNDKDNDGELEADEIETTKGIVYIPASPGNDGMIKAELDSELIQGATVNIQYVITVANKSEVDYDTKDYYLYGKEGTKDQIIRYIPSEIYDYLDNTLAAEQNEDWEVKEISTYNSEVSEPTVLEDYLYKYSSTSTDSEGNKIEYKGYELFKEWYNIEEWNMSNIKTARMTRLADKTILYNKKDTTNMYPGDIVTLAELNASKVLTNTDEISLSNDVEITKVTQDSKTGRRLDKSQLYDRGEIVTITPPTGESTDYILISTLGTTFLITLATGIVFIKKKILK